MLTKRRVQSSKPLPAATSGVSRRQFLSRSGLASLTLGAGALVRPSSVRAAAGAQLQGVERRKTICPFCSVGCSIWAEVKNGVWISQEPVFESPINLGTHCAKGAATRDSAHGERRLKYPMKKEAGAWKRITWKQAIDEIGDHLLKIRGESGPDSVFWCGSSKHTNEASYLMRKFAAFWGSNNCDHQARICHSTTVAGVASTYGYGAMTNSFNDIHKSKAMLLMGGNPAQAHPVSMQHILRAKEAGSKLIVVDPRFTRTAVHADEYVRIRSGTDVAFIWGLVREIITNGWEDKDYIAKRVFRFDDVRKEVDSYTPEEVQRITGVPAEQVKRVAKMFADLRPGTLIWCMGLTQSTIGINKVRAASILQLALGNIGASGGGANIFRGHDNVQGATDIGPNADTLPGYYGESEGAWQHWAGVWDVDYNWLKSRFASKDMMEAKGITISRWHDGVLLNADQIDQPHPLRAMIYWGHAPNSQTRGPDVKKAIDTVELLVVVDPVPSATAALADRRDNFYLLPATTTMECAGSVTNSQRAVQWREKVVEPLFESKTDYAIIKLFADKLGFGQEMFKHIKIENGEPVAEEILREVNRGAWSIGYTGQSPERLKLHMQHQDKFDPTTTMGMADPVKGEYYGLPWPCWGTPELKHPGTPLLYDNHKSVQEGGLPFRAAWGVAYQGETLLAEHSSTPGAKIADGYPEITMAVLQKLGLDSQLTPEEMGVITATAQRLLSYQSSFGAGPQKETGDSNTLAPPGPRDQQAPRETQASGQDDAKTGAQAQGEHMVESTGQQPGPNQGGQQQPVGQQAQAQQNAAPAQPPSQNGAKPPPTLQDLIAQVNWKTDLSGGIQRVAVQNGLAPYGNGKARCFVWNYPDPVPKHREPLYTARRDLLPQYRTYDDRKDWRLPVKFWSIQQVNHADQFPLVLTSGRLVEYEGGGDETRSNLWLAEFQQEMFAEINPADAARVGVADGQPVWVKSPEGSRVRVMARVTTRVGAGTVFMPFHFAGFFQGRNLAGNYPAGTVPYVTGESANTATTYGDDVVTFMQETKTTLCQIEKA